MGRLERVRAIHFDLLKEIGNIGAGHAATALSQMLRHSMNMHVPHAKVIPFDEISGLVGGDETVVAAVFFRVEGDVPSSMFFMLPLEQASYLVQQMTGKAVAFHEPPFNEFGMSALQEVGNILVGSYLSSLADFTNLKLQASPPALGIDMAGAFINDGLMEISHESDCAIVIETCFFGRKTNLSAVNAQVLLLPDPSSFEKMFQALGVPLYE